MRALLEGMTDALLHAAAEADLRCARLLLEQGAEVTSKATWEGNTLFHSQETSEGNSALHLTCDVVRNHRDNGVVRFLLGAGAAADATNILGQTSLVLACTPEPLARHRTSEKYVNRTDRRPDARTTAGWTALTIAEAKRNRAVLALLKEHMAKRIEREEKLLAFAMSQHPRLGENSLVRGLDEGLVQIVIKLA